jgi:hypothetical protein
VKITKEKLKEVEEEWQNNLLNWKSKRRQSRGTAGSDECESQESQTRKIKTFSEILNEKAKSGHRIGYNLQRYIGNGEGEDDTEVISSNQNQEQGRIKVLLYKAFAKLTILILLFQCLLKSIQLKSQMDSMMIQILLII